MATTSIADKLAKNDYSYKNAVAIFGRLRYDIDVKPTVRLQTQLEENNEKINKTNDGITAIYVRRSVSDKDKGNNSLSIAAHKEECVRFVGDSEYRIYCDDGKSGKDIEKSAVRQS